LFRLLAIIAAFVVLGGCSSPPLTEAHFLPRGVGRLTPWPDAEPTFTERVYVPVYSNIYWGSGETVTELSVTLSVRNVDPQRPIALLSIGYYDSEGSLVREYLDKPAGLSPMGTADFVIERNDETGGAGANFLVEWGAESAVYEPVMESVMLGQIGSASISFVSQGRTLTEHGPTHNPAGDE